MLVCMNLFKKLFKTENDLNKEMKEEEHSVIIHFNYNLDDLSPLYDLKDRLESIIDEKGVGEYDGHEIATDYSDGFLYMYGTNAEALFKAIQPVLDNTPFIKGATARLIFGMPGSGAKEIEVEI